MIAKVIEVQTDVARVPGFLAAQEVWNAESRKSHGYLGEFVGTEPSGMPIVIVFWASHEFYEEWMATEHDRIASLARTDDHCDSIVVTIVG